MKFLRPFVALLPFAAVTALGLLAHAQTAGTTGTTSTGGTSGSSGTTLTQTDFDVRFLKKVGPNETDADYEYMNATDFTYYFNRARCDCNSHIRIRVALTTSGRQKVSRSFVGQFKLRAGDPVCVCTDAASCGTPDAQTRGCADIGGGGVAFSSLINSPAVFSTTVRALFAAGKSSPGDSVDTICGKQVTQNLWLWLSDNSQGGVYTVLGQASTSIGLDGVPPPSPTGLDANPGNEALAVSWDSIGVIPDSQGYILFCSRGDNPVFKAGSYKPSFNTDLTECPKGAFADPPVTAGYVVTNPAAVDITASALDATDGGTSDGSTSDSSTSVLYDASYDAAADAATNKVRTAQVGAPPLPIAERNPLYACSDIITAGTSDRIFRLQNNIPYAVGVASVDKNGNPSPITEAVLQTPVLTRDFYRGYRTDGGASPGGFCSVATAGERPSRWLALLLIGPLVVLIGRRITRRRR